MTSILPGLLASVLLTTSIAIDQRQQPQWRQFAHDDVLDIVVATSTKRRNLQEPDQCVINFFNGTTLILETGETFGDLITTRCGSSIDFPCFCSPLTEQNGVLCPYCSFETMDGNTVCARDGGSIEFTDTDGKGQECECDYLANSQVDVTCRTFDVDPPQQCFLVRNIGQCAQVTEPTSPMEDCDCYNYCKGEFAGCCKFGEGCQSPSCETLGDVVAGCQIDPNKPPVEMEEPPSAGPTAEPAFCGVTLNTENCAELLQGQSPIEGCECYNFCSDRPTECCPSGFDCSASCEGLFDGEVATFGCLLVAEPPVPTCFNFFDECNEHSECCSGRCAGGRCRSNRAAAAGKRGGLKLSGTRGGSAGSPSRPAGTNDRVADAGNGGERRLLNNKAKGL